MLHMCACSRRLAAHRPSLSPLGVLSPPIACNSAQEVAWAAIRFRTARQQLRTRRASLIRRACGGLASRARGCSGSLLVASLGSGPGPPPESGWDSQGGRAAYRRHLWVAQRSAFAAERPPGFNRGPSASGGKCI